MKQVMKLGVTDRTVLVFIPDPASTDGSGKTGLNAAALTVSYARVETDNDVVVTDVTSSLSDLSALTDAHSDWGLKEVSNTLAPGLYRLDLADAVFASGAWSAVVYVMITSSAAAASPMEFILVAYDQLDSVRLGLTALPNAAADAAGGLIISDAGGLDVDAQLVTKVNSILEDTGTTLDDLIDDLESRLGTPSDLGSGATVAANLVDIEGQTDDIGAAGAGLTALATAAELAKVPKSDGTATWNATALASLQSEATDALNAYDPPTKAELDSGLDALPTAAENADAIWDEATTSHTTSGTFGEQVKTDVDAILADTNELQTDWVNGGRLDLLIDAILEDTGTTLQAEVGGIQTDTEDIQSRLPAALTGDGNIKADALKLNGAAPNNLSAAQVNTEADTALSDVGLTTTVTGRVDAAVSTRASQTSVDDLPTNAELATSQASADDATLAAIAALNNLSAAQVNSEVVDALTVDVVADSVASDGSRPTIAQAVYEMLQFLTEKSVSGTTVTVNKPDGSTSLMTFTLDDGSAPTSITRSG